MTRFYIILTLFLSTFQVSMGQNAEYRALSTDSLVLRAFTLADEQKTEAALAIVHYLQTERSLSSQQEFRLEVVNAFLPLRNSDIPNALFALKQTLRKAEEVGDPFFTAHLHHGLGLAYNEIDNPEAAGSHYDEAIQLYEQAGEIFWASDIASERGLSVMFRSDYLRGVSYLTKALGFIISQDTSKAATQAYLPKVYMNLAIGNNRLNEKALAIEHAKLSIHYGHKTTHYNQPSFYATLGAIYRGMEDYDMALKAYKKSLTIARNRQHVRSMRMSLSNIAHLFSLSNELDSAIHYLRNADKINDVSEFHLQNFNVDLARYYLKAGRADSAIYFAEKAEVYGQGISNFRVLRDTYRFLAGLYQDQGQIEKALNYERLHKIASDSILQQASAREYDQLKVKLQTMDKEYELAKLNDQVATQRKLNIYLILLVIAAVLVVFFVVKYWLSERRRKNMEIDNILISKKSIEADLRNSQQELADSAVRMLAQHQFLEELESTVKQSASGNRSIDPGTARQINKVIKLNKVNTNDWEAFMANFGNAHGDFFSKLKNAYPSLTSGELKHCALLKMNTSVKQAAQLLGVDQKSVTQARYRLKKKMQLTSEQSIHEAIYRF